MKKNNPFVLLCLFACLSFIGVNARSNPIAPTVTDPKHRVWDMVKGIHLEKKGIFTRKAYALHHKGNPVVLFEPKLAKSEPFTLASQAAKDWFHLYFYPSVSDLKKALELLKSKTSEAEWVLETSGERALAEKEMPKIKSWVRRFWHWIVSWFTKAETAVVMRGDKDIQDALHMHFYIHPEFLNKAEHEKKQVIDDLEALVKKVEGFSKKAVEQSHHLYEEHIAARTYHHKANVAHLHQHKIETLDGFGGHDHLALTQYHKCYRCFGESSNKDLGEELALHGHVDEVLK